MSGQKIRQAEGLLMRVPDPSSDPVLPVKGQKNVLITSALPYVNNVPHLGNIIGSSLSADVFARYCRTRNLPTLFVCGNDEYGTAVETKAAEEGVPPLEITSHFHQLHAQVYKWFEIGFDLWGRTATPKHTEFTQQMYKNVHERGFLGLETSDQPYCEEDASRLADRFIEGTCPQCGNKVSATLISPSASSDSKDARGDQCDKCLLTFASPTSLLNPRCKRNKDHTVSTRPSTQACLRLDKLQPELEDWIRAAQAKGKWASNSTISAEGYFLEPRMSGEGLKASAITRDLKWGVEVPKVGDEEEDVAMEGKVFFVWFDALNGYHSITASQIGKWQEWWMNPDEVELYQFMGKDNVFYHTVLFPAMLLADGRRWTMPHKVCHTNYLYYESQKFSKSRNIGVFGNNAEETGVPAAVWRYYLLSIRPEVSDSAFMWDGLIAANNEDLVANLGHFVYRTISFINVNYNSIVPTPSELEIGESSSESRSFNEKLDATFVHDINHLLSGFRRVMDETHLKGGLAITMGISARGNQYLRETRLDNFLHEQDPRRCAEIVLNAVNLVYILSVVLHPFMPSVSDSILEQLNAPARTLPEVFAVDILPGHRVGTAKQLFKEIANVGGAQVDAWRKQFGRERPATNPESGVSEQGSGRETTSASS